MKVASCMAMTAAVMVTFPALASASSGSGQPGYCNDDKDCETNYVCISVQTTRSGIEDVKQCLPYTTEGDVCSGTFAGLCPSFSTWDDAFQAISSVCAYALPSGVDQCLTSSFSGSDTSGYVSCVEITEGSGSDAESVGVIYNCVDFDGTDLLYDTTSENYALSETLNYTGVVNDGCMNPSNADDSEVVCSGRGTCAPYTQGGMDYYCDCNVGYNGTYCQKIVSNACTLESQCQAGTCNLTTQECECDAGTMGDQCAYCDPSSSAACNGHGTCVSALSSSSGSTSTSTSSTDGSSDVSAGTVTAAGSGSATRFLIEAVGMASGSGDSTHVCECDTGYKGDSCDSKVKSSSGKDSTDGSTKDSSSAAGLVSSVTLLASAMLLAVLN